MGRRQPGSGLASSRPQARDKRYFLDALIVEKLVSFDLTAPWWDVTLINSNPDYEANWYQFLTLGQGMRDFAKKIGWGDVHQLDRSTGGEGKNPQVTEMVDSWKGKMSGKVVLKFPVDDEARKYVFKNVAHWWSRCSALPISILEAASSTTWWKPRPRLRRRPVR
ncbi:MAG: hypothetical protein AMXMBFR33_72370 [Candidatus Xenobia bacterium]